MTIAFIVACVVIVVMLVFIVLLVRDNRRLDRDNRNQHIRVIETADLYYKALAETKTWKQRYLDLEEGLVNEASDMDYVRDSLLRAADDDPTT